MANRPKITRELTTWVFQNGRCAYCSIEMCIDGDIEFAKKRQATWDHVVPKSRGGHGLRGNRVLACIECNNDKADFHLADWIESKFCPFCGKEFRLRTDCLRHVKGVHKKKWRQAKDLRGWEPRLAHPRGAC